MAKPVACSPRPVPAAAAAGALGWGQKIPLSGFRTAGPSNEQLVAASGSPPRMPLHGFVRAARILRFPTRESPARHGRGFAVARRIPLCETMATV